MVSQDTRESLLSSATEVFVEQGFDGARVDEIARRAGANKALIYYYFGSKQGLYRATLLHLFNGPVALLDELRRTESDPLRRLESFYGALARMFSVRPGIPHIMLREILAGGAHIDAEALRSLSALIAFVVETIQEGVAKGRIRPVNPFFAHVSMIAPLLVYSAGRSFRERLLPVAVPDQPEPDALAFEEHLRDLLGRLLAVEAPRPS
jgi:TetR/AcrR family transcriptional regulator